MAAARRLALEHLTAPCLSPEDVVDLAAQQGWAGATVLLAPFRPFPQTDGIDLVGDRVARRAVRRASTLGGVAIALAYPFVLSPRADAASLRPTLEAAADVGALGAGLLVYDRDAGRAEAQLQAFCALAAEVGVRPVLEFYGGSAAPTLQAADALADRCADAAMGLCVDLLHLARSRGVVGDLAGLPAGRIAHAQLSDAPLAAPADRDREAAYGRLAPGEGELDLAAFIDAIPEEVWMGLEVPPHGLTADDERARALRLMSLATRQVERAEARRPRPA